MKDDDKKSNAASIVAAVGIIATTLFAFSGPVAPVTIGDLSVQIEGPSLASQGEQVVLSARGDGVSSYYWSYPSSLKPYEGCDRKDFVFSTNNAGDYEIEAIASGSDGKQVGYRHKITIGLAPKPPTPTPPGPGPDPGPTPPIPTPVPPVTVELPFRVYIIHESTDDTSDQNRMWSLLRQGPAADYLKAKGHLLDILDDDDAAKADPYKKWLPFAPPEVIIVDKVGNKVDRFKLPAGYKPDPIIDAVKKGGG